MHVSVIILNYNGNSDTISCVASLQKQTYTDLEIIVVDNGSKIPFSHPDVTLIHNKRNLGFAEGNNVGIRYALKKESDAILLLNNDTEVEPDCIEKFVTFSKDHPNAVLGGKLIQFHDRQHLDHIGGMWNEEEAQFDLIGANAPIEQYTSTIECHYVCGAALFASAEIFEEVGLLEPDYFLYWEEADFCMRAHEEGYHVLYCPEALIYHKVSASMVGGKPHGQYYWWRNRLLWMKRHHKLPSGYKTVLPEIAKLLRHSMLVKFQLLFNKSAEKKKKVKGYRASLNGVVDYFRGRFGAAPNWLTKK